ncbi:hypothetical protein GCM10007380_05480 [Gottfriedia solisilvae]|uniref:Uncharacterized protein n=1 Tax=Gottfriedia solisilvae TaxID=1516104 RepID=A0A8J3EWD1_9BACI|nr:hypothetical protein GCM10007380_05480 [Gottfriedia solisilvae]
MIILIVFQSTNDIYNMMKVIKLIKKNMVTLSNIIQSNSTVSSAMTKGNMNVDAVACPNVRIGI